MIFYVLGVFIVFLLLTTFSVVDGRVSFEFFSKGWQFKVSKGFARFILALFWPITLALFLFFLLTGLIKFITITVLNKFKS